MSSVGVDPNRPQEVARQLNLRSGLAWKICKVVQEASLADAVPHIPGPTGVKLFLTAVKKAGAPSEFIDAARSASTAFQRMVEIHTGDRATLETMIGGMATSSAQSEQNRKLAFQGNSGIWGVRATVQLSLNILSPNQDDPSLCDLAQVAGLLGFRRLRPDARWLLFRRERWTDDAPQEEQDNFEPLDPESPVPDGIPLIPAFCSTPLPEVEVIHASGEDQYELPPGPVGNAVAMDCVYGSVSRAIGPAHADAAGEFAEVGLTMITPAEHMLLDLLVHRDFTWALQPGFMMYSRMDGGAMNAKARRDRNLLQFPETVVSLGRGTTPLATSLLPRYNKLVAFTFDRLKLDADDFHVFRVTIPYPPIPTVAMFRAELPVR
ncbi:MAG: hypothetical protein KC983_10640 [Phycisphaerales bacterium]|nr:hypothetical protein [Phycisphaerales bacterium]